MSNPPPEQIASVQSSFNDAEILTRDELRELIAQRDAIIAELHSASLADKAEIEKAKAEDFMKKWCRHIKWDSYVQYDARTTCHVNTPAWVIYCPTPSSLELPVPRSWKVCPVCGAERPTKANTKAAAHCALMDMGDDE